ncbi:MAG: helix-turn-helix domain-containing protein [Oscillospiraceae bacterium]|nr:helix-turn-helix domain-containing protein [Oscillospiraceae bacterium]
MPQEKTLQKFVKRFNDLVMEFDGGNQQKFAKRVGMSRQSVNNYCNATRTPDIYVLYKICSNCNVSAHWLLGLTDTRSPDSSVQAAVTLTGLSEEAITAIINLPGIDDPFVDLVGDLLEELNFLLTDDAFGKLLSSLSRVRRTSEEATANFEKYVTGNSFSLTKTSEVEASEYAAVKCFMNYLRAIRKSTGEYTAGEHYLIHGAQRVIKEIKKFENDKEGGTDGEHS